MHDASYIHTTCLTRLPAYLTVRMVRFAWWVDVGRKAKIRVREISLSLLTI